MHFLTHLYIYAKLAAISFLAFTALNIFMWSASAVFANFLWVPQQFFGVNFIKENWLRVHLAEKEYKTSKSEGKPLIAIVGLSSASEGINILDIAQKLGDEYRILPLSGAGRNTNELKIYAQPLLESSLTPELVIFAINPFHFMDPIEKQAAPKTLIKKIPTHKLLTGWFSGKREDVRRIVDTELFKWRVKLHNNFNASKSDINIKPWSESTRMGLIQLTTEQQWQDKLLEYGKRGYFNRNSYTKNDHQLNSFVQLVQGFTEKDSQVTIVLMPEHSILREQIPQLALERTYAPFNKETLNHVKIIDIRDKVNDQGFKDISHANQEGRIKTTELFLKVIDTYRRSLYN